ncbi:MAG: tetratricopeptide repeat protein [Caldilinea sp.]
MIAQPDNLPDDQIEVWQQAVESFQRAYRMQVQGDLAGAIREYKASIRLYPTAEAYTFLGWTYAHLNLYDEAVAACRLAIEVDPDFGNPYNDIGAYLLELDRAEESLTWFEQALIAPRYDARVFAFFNLGRAHERLGNWRSALDFYQQTANYYPHYRPAADAAHRLLGRMN